MSLAWPHFDLTEAPFLHKSSAGCTAAAALRSLTRELVHEPMKTRSSLFRSDCIGVIIRA